MISHGVLNPVSALELQRMDAEARRMSEVEVEATVVPQVQSTGREASPLTRCWCYGLGAVGTTGTILVVWLLSEVVLFSVVATSALHSRTSWFTAGACYLAAFALTVQAGLQRRAHTRSVSAVGDVDKPMTRCMPRTLDLLQRWGVAMFSSPIPLFTLAFASRCAWFAMKATFWSVCGGDPGGAALTAGEERLKDTYRLAGTLLNRLGTALWFSAFTAVGVSWENSAAGILPPRDDTMLAAADAQSPGASQSAAASAKRDGGMRGLYRCLRAKHSSKRSIGYYIMIALYLNTFLLFLVTALIALAFRIERLTTGNGELHATDLESIANIEAYVTVAISIALIVSLALIADRLVQVRARSPP